MDEDEIMNNEIIYTLNRYSAVFITENDIYDLQHTNIPLSELINNNRKISDFNVSRINQLQFGFVST